MRTTRLIIIGGGEHARVVAEAALSSGTWEVLGFVDPEPCPETVSRLALPHLGTDEVLPTFDAHVILGVGAVGVQPSRQVLTDRLTPHIRRWATVIHAAAWVSPTATIADGAVVLAGAAVNSGARIGRHCVVNTGAVIEHDVEVGEFAQVAPGATIGGGTTIGAGAFIGLGSHVRDHIRVGENAMVTMGTTVVRDVRDGGRVGGPFRQSRAADDRRSGS